MTKVKAAAKGICERFEEVYPSIKYSTIASKVKYSFHQSSVNSIHFRTTNPLRMDVLPLNFNK
jgi:hypothetical protein